MERAKGAAAMGVSAWFLAALVACATDGDSAAGERRTLRVARKGGQSGMEGSCLPAPEPRPFSVADVRPLIEGTYETTLAYRAERRSSGSSFDDAAGLPMKVEVELQGEPRIDTEPFEACTFRIEQDVQVTLSLEEPALDVLIETTASAFSSTFAVTQLELGSDVATALGLPARDVTTFSLAFDASGIKGTFEQLDECGRAVFPASVRCPDWSSIEVDLDRQRPGLRARVLSALQELSEVPLEWSDGTQTTLAVSVSEAPEWACSSDWAETFCPERVTMPVSVRAVTADGRLDAELPADLSLEVATEASAMDASAPEPFCSFARTAGDIEGVSIIASHFGVTSSGPSTEVIPPLEPNTGFSLHVWRAPESPERIAAEIRMLALAPRDTRLTPPIDATTDPAAPSCVVFAPSGEVERR